MTPPPQLASELHRASLRLATRTFAGMFLVGTLLGLEPLLSGRDPGAFFAPLFVFICSAVALVLSERGRFRLGRRVFATSALLYMTATMLFAAPLIRVAIGFPLGFLVIILLHLMYEAERAERKGWLALGLYSIGLTELMLFHEPDWRLFTACVVQFLVIGFANRVLGRLSTGWESALHAADEARRELNDAYTLALEASQAKSSFLASMSHELRTPLNGIIGYAELVEEELQEGGSPDPADLARIQKAGNHLVGLVNQVLDLSRVESGQLELEVQEVVLTELVDDVAGTIQPQLAIQNNRLVLEKGDVPPLHLDPMRTRQILTNLLANAAKFTEAGTVTLSLHRVANNVEIVVADTGCGIPEDRIERVFEPFKQADSSTQRTHGGTGLGLAISRKLAREMGGDLTATSKPGTGSRFVLAFPAP